MGIILLPSSNTSFPLRKVCWGERMWELDTDCIEASILRVLDQQQEIQCINNIEVQNYKFYSNAISETWYPIAKLFQSLHS